MHKHNNVNHSNNNNNINNKLINFNSAIKNENHKHDKYNDNSNHGNYNYYKKDKNLLVSNNLLMKLIDEIEELKKNHFNNGYTNNN